MIYVERGPEPADFVDDSDAWTQEFLEAKHKNPNQSANKFWSKVRKRQAMGVYAQKLYAVFHGKCAFCESKMNHVSPAHIEHYRPKGKANFEGLMFQWENWLLACPICNSNKGSIFENCDNQPCLLNPTSDDPGQHLGFLRAQLLHKSERGEKTIKQISLNRTDLAQERAWWLTDIECLLLLVLFVPQAKMNARELLIWAMQPNAPYSAMTRSYLQIKTPKLANPETPHPIIEPNKPLEQIASLLRQYNDRLLQVM